ncbi:MAG: hypothetical protein ACM3QS_11685 [Bacteroidota bacterium]
MHDVVQLSTPSMNLFVLKLVLAPLIIGSASLAGRKWGSAVSGWLVGMPLTTGPVVFFLALSHDAAFAARAALGVLSGGFSLVIYALSYAWIARRFAWPVAISGSLLLFAISTTLLQNASFPLVPLFFAVVIVILLGLRLMPPGNSVGLRDEQPGRWDLPARVLLGTSVILLLTGVAPLLGARLTGLLATFPLYISILTVFEQRHQGPDGAAHVLRGLMYGMFAFAGFFITLGLMLEPSGTGPAFAVAVLVALIVQGASLWVLRRAHPLG